MSTPGAAVEVAFKPLPHFRDLHLPEYATDHSAGVDLRAAVEKDVVIEPGGWETIPLGFSMALPDGFEAQIRPRSGLALRHGVTVLNAPGTVDGDYRGEVKVILINLGKEPFTVSFGERICQMIIAPYVRARWNVVDALPASGRGEGGFGSTGNS